MKKKINKKYPAILGQIKRLNIVEVSDNLMKTKKIILMILVTLPVLLSSAKKNDCSGYLSYQHPTQEISRSMDFPEPQRLK